MVASAVPALAIAILWLRIKEPVHVNLYPQSQKGTDDREGRGRIRSVSFYLLTISYTLQGYVGYIFVTWFYLYLVQERNFSLLSGAWILFVIVFILTIIQLRLAPKWVHYGDE